MAKRSPPRIPKGMKVAGRLMKESQIPASPAFAALLNSGAARPGSPNNLLSGRFGPPRGFVPPVTGWKGALKGLGRLWGPLSIGLVAWDLLRRSRENSGLTAEDDLLRNFLGEQQGTRMGEASLMDSLRGKSEAMGRAADFTEAGQELFGNQFADHDAELMGIIMGHEAALGRTAVPHQPDIRQIAAMRGLL